MKKIKLQFVKKMSDVEENEPMEPVAYCAKMVAEAIKIEEAVATVLGPVPTDDLRGRMYFVTALRETLRSGLIQYGLNRGLHETTKVLEKRQAILSIVAKYCDDDAVEEHVRVQALCQKYQIPFLTALENKELSKYSGFCKLDDNYNKCEVGQCTFVAVKDWGKKGLTFGGTLSYGFGFCHIKEFFGYKKTGRFTIKRINQQ